MFPSKNFEQLVINACIADFSPVLPSPPSIDSRLVCYYGFLKVSKIIIAWVNSTIQFQFILLFAAVRHS